jgi:hypothetical protein
VTAHTIETAQPSVRTWGKKLIIFPVLPKDPEEETDLEFELEWPTLLRFQPTPRRMR